MHASIFAYIERTLLVCSTAFRFDFLHQEVSWSLFDTDAAIPVKSSLSHLLLSQKRRSGAVNIYFTYTVAVMKEKWVYHMEEKLKSRYNVAHSQTGRKRMF